MLIWVYASLPVTMCRFSSKFKEGEVTTLHRDDLPVLKEILSHSVDPIEVNVHTHTHTHTRFFSRYVVSHDLSVLARSLLKTAEQLLPPALFVCLMDKCVCDSGFFYPSDCRPPPYS